MIQKLSLSRYSEIIELWEEVELNPQVEGRDHPDKMKKQINSGTVLMLGKIIDDKLVGVILVSHDNRKGWINRLAVHSDSRNQGIGKELIKAAEEYLFEEKGIEVYSALIFDDNITSKQCFLGAGYEQWDEVKYFSKRLSPSS